VTFTGSRSSQPERTEQVFLTSVGTCRRLPRATRPGPRLRHSVEPSVLPYETMVLSSRADVRASGRRRQVLKLQVGRSRGPFPPLEVRRTARRSGASEVQGE